MNPPARIVTLAVLSPGTGLPVLLPPFPVETPWWQDIEPVTRAAREQYGLDVTVLRLLRVERANPPGGGVTYLAEANHAVSGPRWDEPLDDHPLRMSWAKPGGPAADLDWALTRLQAAGLPATAAPTQVRTWNLSSLWRIPTRGGEAWLKVVPPFFAHEGAVIALVGGRSTPSLIAHDGPRILLRAIPGSDLYGAARPLLGEMVERLVGLQAASTASIDTFLAAGVPDWRAGALTHAIEGVFRRNAHALTTPDREALAAFVASLPARWADIAACGLPDTLVHGDFHPGNCRAAAETTRSSSWTGRIPASAIRCWIRPPFSRASVARTRCIFVVCGIASGAAPSPGATHRAPPGCSRQSPPRGSPSSTRLSWTRSNRPSTPTTRATRSAGSPEQPCFSAPSAPKPAPARAHAPPGPSRSRSSPPLPGG